MILFMMSRRAEDGEFREAEQPAETVRPNHRTLTENTVSAQRDISGNVTREEMQRLFGTALRVR